MIGLILLLTVGVLDVGTAGYLPGSQASASTTAQPSTMGRRSAGGRARQRRQARGTAVLDQVQRQQRQQRESALTAALQQYDRDPVDLAVTVVDRTTGRTFSYNGQRPFETASIVKVDILATRLLQAQRARRSLSAREKGLATRMIEYSDNDAATQLWWSTGGISASTGAFGLTATAGGAGGYWGLTTTTAEDQARLVGALADPNGPVHDGGYVLSLMGQVAAGQAWGISAAARPGESVALKDGWMPRDNQRGRWTVNSIGRITGAGTDVVIVVLSRGHPSLGAGIATVEAVTRQTRTYLSW
jgi:beta-lactamase class A